MTMLVEDINGWSALALQCCTSSAWSSKVTELLVWLPAGLPPGRHPVGCHWHHSALAPAMHSKHGTGLTGVQAMCVKSDLLGTRSNDTWITAITAKAEKSPFERWPGMQGSGSEAVAPQVVPPAARDNRSGMRFHVIHCRLTTLSHSMPALMQYWHLFSLVGAYWRWAGDPNAASKIEGDCGRGSLHSKVSKLSN